MSNLSCIASVSIAKDTYIARLQQRMPVAIQALAATVATFTSSSGTTTSSAALSLSVKEANALLLGVGIALNKTEFENAFDHFPGACEGELDAISFSEALGSPVSTGAEPRFFNSNGVAVPRGEVRSNISGPGSTVHSKHLGLSGTSHIDFGTQHRPFPAHWGVPPNVAMKGQHGIMRDLASGYGRGNGPLEKWVLEHIEQDAKSGSDELGRKPYPYGNYSHGSAAENPGPKLHVLA